jgi:hypothetical protein
MGIDKGSAIRYISVYADISEIDIASDLRTEEEPEMKKIPKGRILLRAGRFRELQGGFPGFGR